MSNKSGSQVAKSYMKNTARFHDFKVQTAPVLGGSSLLAVVTGVSYSILFCKLYIHVVPV